MAARNTLIARPQWVITNQLTLPLITVADSGKKSVRGTTAVAINFLIFLDTLFTEKVVTAQGRSMEQDQFQIYKSMEGALQAAGMDGKACLLRTICEIQRNQFGQYTLAGELVTLLLTPKKGESGLTGFLHDYLVAEKVGRSLNESCGDSFPRCLVSLIEFFRSYGTNTAFSEGGSQDDIELNLMSEEVEPLERNLTDTEDNNECDHKVEFKKEAKSIKKKHHFGKRNEI